MLRGVLNAAVVVHGQQTARAVDIHDQPAGSVLAVRGSRRGMEPSRPPRHLAQLTDHRATVTRSLKRSVGNRDFTSAATAIVPIVRHTSTPHVPGFFPPLTSSTTTA